MVIDLYLLIAGREHIFGIRKLFYFLFLKQKNVTLCDATFFTDFLLFSYKYIISLFFQLCKLFTFLFLKQKTSRSCNATFFTEIYVFRTIGGNVGQQNLSHASLTLRVEADRLYLFSTKTSYHCFFRFANFLCFFF